MFWNRLGAFCVVVRRSPTGRISNISLNFCPTCAFGRVRLCPSCAFGAACRSNLRILFPRNLPGTLPAMAHRPAAAALPDYDVMRMVVRNFFGCSPGLFGTRKLVVLHKVLGTGVSLGKIAIETLRSMPGVLGHRDILESVVGRAVKFRDVSGWRCGWCLRGGPCWCLVLVSLVRRFRPQPLRQNKLTVPTASQEEGCEYRRRRLSLEIYVLFVACGDGCGGPRRGGVISEVCAKQTVVGSDFATIRTHPT